MDSGPRIERSAGGGPFRPTARFEYRYHATRPWGTLARLRHAFRNLYRGLFRGLWIVLLTAGVTLGLLAYLDLVRGGLYRATAGAIEAEDRARGLDPEPIPDDGRERHARRR